MASRLRQKAKGWGARIRFGEGMSRDEWIALDVPRENEPLARDRLNRLQAMAKRLSELGKHAKARTILEDAGATRSERGFSEAEKMIAEMAPERTPQRTPKTFRKVVQELCDGTLHKLYPDEIGTRSAASNDARRGQLSTFFPVLGDKTFDAITRELLDEAKLLIPKNVSQNTRITYIRELRFLMRLAVEPLRLVDHVAHISVPKPTPTALFQLLYPDEEEQIAGTTEAPFEERFLIAFLCRNGGRISETLQYTWEACDLERGTIRVAKKWTKTKRARYWDLEPDVLEALRLRRKQIPDAHVIFVPPPGRVFNRMTFHKRLPTILRLAELSRLALFEAPEGERPLTTHDFRASFVTLARSIGMSDIWIRDRSGHESREVLEKYDRGVRHARERGLKWWAPMAIALGMPGARVRERLGDWPNGLGQSWAKGANPSVETEDFTSRRQLFMPPAHPINAANLGGDGSSLAPDGALGPAGFSTSGQSHPFTGDELKELLSLATERQRWHLLAPIGKALEAIGERAPVASLDAARVRRDRKRRE